MVTLKDIGLRLGISPTQVSRALGGYPDVSDDTRQRVEDAVRQLGYRPNPNALRLKAGRSGVVGLVVPENSEQEESNILLEILLGLAVEFWKRDVLVVLNVLPKAAPSTKSYTRLFRQAAVDGFVVVNPSADPGLLAFLMAESIPFVTHGRAATTAGHAFVDLDNRAVGQIMAARLADLGHRDIAFVDGPQDSFSAEERLSGLSGVLAARGLSQRDDLIHRGMMTEQFGEAAVLSLFKNPDRAPTAIMVGNLVLATGVMRGLQRLGLSVPGDVSVMAHDDVLARYPRTTLTPDLSGTASPFTEAWGDIAGFLGQAIDGKNPGGLQKLIAPVAVQGASVAAPARA
ncbi:LacI family DNA-binding transcriptional regulator [Paracoccus lutimaris]|uniref:LacI family transcriptional regulator n=1 Tax=Paracoccus lutimaris TaxID=1490030 RepID=A0A368Z743_9RHOB|nr:LacI family DNA-binding transcriptional regulator [Paracoccus lutimaris]RCW88290.1 LacI family transcriptional regulator [Paracoccus lutimaris]